MNIASKRTLRKVPEIILLFWVVKLLTTAMGEATSDFFVYRYNPYLVVILGGIALLLVLMIQFSVSRYRPWVYWAAVSMVAVFGTMAADALHIQLHVAYIVSSIFFAVVLMVVFIYWHKSEKTLSIHSINTRRREMFYWAAVLATFALGTATGDLTAITVGLGYFSAGLLFAGLIALPAIAYWFGLNEIFCFWFAYILTRPLGASFADWMSKSPAVGGLGWGDGRVGVMLTIVIIGFVSYLALSHRDIKPEQRPN
jgi:uncharacterized membrane-anchored protein